MTNNDVFRGQKIPKWTLDSREKSVFFLFLEAADDRLAIVSENQRRASVIQLPRKRPGEQEAGIEKYK